MPRMKSIMNLQRLSTSNIEENDAKIIDISVNWVEKWVRFFEFFSKKKILFANFFNAHFTCSFFISTFLKFGFSRQKVERGLNF